MENLSIRRISRPDYSAVLQLQGKNTPDQLNEEEKKQGFIVSQMTEETLASIDQSLGILVAYAGNEFAGFVCMVPVAVTPRHPIVEAMVKTFPEQQFEGKNLDKLRVFTYGPICIDRNMRGKGILKKLYAAVKDYTKADYDLGVAFINDSNQHSLSAHVQGLGMTVLTPFNHNGQRFQLVAFATGAH